MRELMITLEVDDLLVIIIDTEYLQGFKAQMMLVYEMIDLGLMTYFQGMEVQQRSGQICLHQSKYARDLLKRFSMSNCKAVYIPLTKGSKFSKNVNVAKADGSIQRNIIVYLLYLSATRPDMMYANCLLSRFMQALSLVHYIVAKRILRHVKGIVDFRMVYLKNNNGKLLGFIDND